MRDTWDLLNEIRSGEISSSLANHILWHETYKEGGMLSRYIEEDSRESRSDYIRRESSRLFEGREGEERLEEVASTMLAKRAFTSLSRDLDSLVSDSNLVLGRIIGNVVEESNKDDRLVTRALYKIFRTTNKEYRSIKHYAGLASTGDADLDRDRNRFFSRRAENLHRLSADQYTREEDYELVDKYGLSASVTRRLGDSSRLDLSVSRIRTELARVQGVNQYSTQVAVNNLMDRVERGGYYNKPGISSVVSLIESASSELNINIFQLNNSSIGDVLYNRIIERAPDILRGDFKVNIVTASNDEGSRGATGFSILGPNALEMERLRILRDELIQVAVRSGMSIGEAQDRVLSNFRLLTTDRKNHSKVLVTDRFASIGSLNLTRPVGSSVNQEGSTYESVRLFHLHKDIDPYLLLPENRELLDDYRVEALYRELYKQGSLVTRESTASAIRSINQRISSAKLFMQVKRVNERFTSLAAYGASNNYYETREANIGGARDIYRHLSDTLDYLLETREGRSHHNKFLMQLDQPYSLSYISDLARSYGLEQADGYAGEMGKELSLDGEDKRRVEFSRVQNRLYELAKQNRLQAVVDVRNYKDKILNPTYDLVERILGDKFSDLYDGSLSKLAGTGSFREKERRLRERGIDNIDLIKQIQMITSGAISLSTMPKQHLKSYMAYNTKTGKAISYYDGSSNLGAFSLGIDQRSNVEFGLLLASSSLRANRAMDLSDIEEDTELEYASENFLSRFKTLSGRDVGDHRPKLSSWESRVDTRAIKKLVSSLDRVNKDLGFEALSYDYFYGDRGNRLGVQVTLNMRNLTGIGIEVPGLESQFRYRFSPLKGYGQGSGFVFAVDQGKVISSVRFINNHSTAIPIPYIDGGYLAGETSTMLDPIANTTMMMSTLAGEMINRSLVLGPQLYLSSTFGEDGISKNIVEYMEWVATGRRQGGNWLRNASPAEITLLQDQLVNRLVMDRQGSALVRVREFTGTNTEQKNRERAEQIEKTLIRLEELKTSDNRLLTLSSIVSDWMGSDPSIYRDIALDVVSSRQDFGYEQYLMKGLRVFRSTLMEDKLTLGQASAYGGAQATFRTSQLGVDSRSTGIIEALERSNRSGVGVGRLIKYMTYIPRTYGPTSNHLAPGSIVNVAEGGGSRPTSDIDGGVTTLGLYKQSLGDMVDIGLLSYVGVGSVLNRTDYLKYLGQLLGKGTNIPELETDSLIKNLMKDYWGDVGREVDTLVTYTFNNKKYSQIPQRLKNVIGSKPLTRIDDWVRNILESEDPRRGVVLARELDKRMDSLRQEVKDVLRKRGGVKSERALEEEANLIINEDSRIGLLFGVGVRSVLGNEAAMIVEEVRREVIRELRLSEEEDLSIHEPLISEISRGRLVAMDLLTSGVKGFTGVHNKKNPIVLVQLGGAYSDYFYANPNYGGPGGTREGFLDRKRIQLKASMLSEDWTDSTGGRPIAEVGDIVAFDKDRNRLLVISAKDGSTKHNVDINSIPREDINRLSVSSVGLREVFKGVIDNMRGPTGESSLATQGMDVWARPGEDSIEYLLSSNQLVGDPESNQLMYEFLMLRTKKPGGGSRIEGKGVLAKGPAVFTQASMFESILNQIAENEQLYRRLEGNVPGSVRSAMSGRKLDPSEIFGMVSASNIKSYSYTHGSAILRDKDMKRTLMSMREEQLAAGLLMSFGTGFIKRRDESDRDFTLKMRRIEGALGRLSISGDLGYWYKQLATNKLLMEIKEEDVRKRAKEYLTLEERVLEPTEADLDRVIQDQTLYKRFTSEVIGKSLMGKAAFSGVQTPSLMLLEADDLVEVLDSSPERRRLRGTSNFRNKLDRIVGVNTNNDYANYEDLGVRSAMMVLTGLDVMAQLIEQPKNITAPTDVNLRDDRVLKQIASVVKGVDLFRLDRDSDYKEEVIASLESMVTSFPVLRLHMDLAFSQSKEPISSKYDSNLEFQHIIKPMRKQARAFSEGGKLSDIRGVVANILAAGNDSLLASNHVNQVKIDTITDLTDLSTRALEEKIRFLGIYGSDRNKRELHSIQKEYRKLGKESSARREDLAKRVSVVSNTRLELVRRGATQEEIASTDRELKSLMRDLVSNYLEEDETLTRRLSDLSREYELDPDKVFGIGQAKAVLDAMDESGQPGRAFSLPTIAGVTQTKDGRINIEFDHSNKIYGYIPSARELKALGVEFGSFGAEEMKATMLLTRGMTVGTSISKVLDKIARNRIYGSNEVKVSSEELAEVMNYWNTARDITAMLTEAASGTRIRKAFAGENRLEGLVSTGAASFLVPPSMMVMAEEGLKRHGLYNNPLRLRAIHNNANNIKSHEASLAENKKALHKRILETLKVQDLGLRVGLSPDAMGSVKRLVDASSRMQSLDKDIRRLMATNANRDLVAVRLKELQRESHLLSKTVREFAFRGEGDNLAKMLGKEEASYWKDVTQSLLIESGSLALSKEEKPKILRILSSRIEERERVGYVMEGLAIGSRSRGIRLDLEEFTNSVRGREKVYTWNLDNWNELTRGLDTNDQKAFLEYKLKAMAEGFNRLHGELLDSYGEVSKELRSSLFRNRQGNQSALSDLRSLRRGLNRIARDVSRDRDFNPSKYIGRIETIMGAYDTTYLMEALSFRSPPPGGTELNRQNLGIIRTLDVLNEATRNTEGNLVQYDTNRNKTLSLFSPLSMLTLNLGDFDGDSFTSVFNGLMDQERSMERARDRAYVNNIRVGRSRTRIESLSKEREYLKREINTSTAAMLRGASRLYETQIPVGTGLMSTGPERAVEALSPRLRQVEEELREEESNLERYLNSIEESNKTISSISLKVNQAKDELNQGQFGDAFRKEIANYMGLNLSFFKGGEDGYLSKDMDISILPTLLQQGSGLFGGLEKEGRDRLRLDQIVRDVFTVGELNEGPDRLVSLVVSKEEIAKRVRALSEDPNQSSNRGTYRLLTVMDEAREELVDTLVGELKQTLHPTSDSVQVGYEEYTKLISSTASKFYSRGLGVKSAQGILNQGAGVSMELTTYDMLTKVLGKAGGDILGKTYNTIINTLYEDSPLIALGHVLGGSGPSKEAIRLGIEGSIGTEATQELYTQVSEASAKAEGLQGFLKNIHQLLRDSIKLKDDDPTLMDNLRAKASLYNETTNEKERTRIVSDIASSIGPGPGLKALTNLNDLILHREDLKSGKNVDELLRDTFGIGVNSNYRYNGGQLEATPNSEFEVLAEELKTLSGKTQVTAYDVISYKVSEDLKALVTGFRFDRDKGNALALMDSSGGYLGRIANTYGIDKLAKSYGFTNTSELLGSGRLIVESPSVEGMDLLESRVMRGGAVDVVASVKATLDLLADRSVTEWYSGSGLSDSLLGKRRRTISNILGVPESQLDKKLADMDRNEKAYLISLVEEGDYQTGKWLGVYGEGLDRFTGQVQARMGVSSVVEGKTSSLLSAEYVESDVTLAMLNLASSNKLNADASIMFYQHLVNTIDPGLEAPNPNDYLEGKQDPTYRAALKEYESKLKGAVLRRVGLGREGQLGKSLDTLFSASSIEIAMEDSSRVVYETGIELIMDQLKETSTGQRVNAVREMLRTRTKSNKGMMHDITTFAREIVQDPEDVESIRQIVDLSLKSVYLDEYDTQTTQYQRVLDQEHKLNVIATQRAQRSTNAMDILAPIGLTLLGGAVFNGGITGDHLQQIAGAGFMSLAYSKGSLATRPGLAVTGSGFRLNSAISESEDVGEGITSWIAREVGFTIGSMVLAPLTQRAIEGTMSRAFNPISGEILDAQESALSRRLKSGAALDIDRYASSKAISGSLSGAVLSAMMGVMLSSVGDTLVSSPRPYQTGSVIDYALDSVRSMVRRADQKRLESELADDNNITIEDEAGTEIVPDSREVSPVDRINMMSIDPMSDIDFTWSTPGYVMVGVTTVADELE